MKTYPSDFCANSRKSCSVKLLGVDPKLFLNMFLRAPMSGNDMYIRFSNLNLKNRN